MASLHTAVARGDIETVTQLYADDVDLEAHDKCGKTAMVIAAELGDVLMLNHLYSLGARPDAAASYNQTKLQGRGHGAVFTDTSFCGLLRRC